MRAVTAFAVVPGGPLKRFSLRRQPCAQSPTFSPPQTIADLPPLQSSDVNPTSDVWYILYLEKNFAVNPQKISSECQERFSKADARGHTREE